jgi:ribose transport system substrate-binding protein
MFPRWLRPAPSPFGVVVVLVTCALSCGLSAAPRIGILLKDKSPGFWVYAEKGATQEAQATGVELVVKAPPTVLDVAAQSRLLAGLATEKLDALVIAPTNPDLVQAAVAELAGKGVKIVALDTPLGGVAQTFVGADQGALAESAAKVFFAAARDGDEIALLRNNSVDRTVIAREEKVRDGLKGRPALVCHSDIFASSEKDTEDEQALRLLTKYPKVTTVFASASRGTMAMIKAVREKGLVGHVKVVGFGTYLPPEAAKAFEDGILVGWIAQQPKDLGRKGVRAAVALASGQPSPAVVHPDFLLVTADNFRSSEVQALMNP